MIASRRFAGLAIGVLAAATLTGIANAGTASAATATTEGPAYLCTSYVDDGVGVCAYGASPVGASDGASTLWYLVSNGSYFYIEDADTGLCMELDNAEDNTVFEASCADDTPFLWKWNGDNILSDWATVVYGKDMCLTYNQAGSAYSENPDFDVIQCKGDAAEEFTFSITSN